MWVEIMLAGAVAFPVLGYGIIHVLRGYDGDPINEFPQPPAPPKDKLKELISALVMEDDWEFRGSTFIHPTGVKIQRNYHGNYVISAENITYSHAFAKAKYEILEKRQRKKQKDEALRRLANKVVKYHEGLLGQPQLESGTELERLEFKTLLEFGPPPGSDMYKNNHNQKLYLSPRYT